MLISDWSSDVCSSDLARLRRTARSEAQGVRLGMGRYLDDQLRRQLGTGGACPSLDRPLPDEGELREGRPFDRLRWHGGCPRSVERRRSGTLFRSDESRGGKEGGRT